MVIVHRSIIFEKCSFPNIIYSHATKFSKMPSRDLSHVEQKNINFSAGFKSRCDFHKLHTYKNHATVLNNNVQLNLELGRL